MKNQLIILACILGTVGIISAQKKNCNPAEYQRIMKEANAFEKKEAYIDAKNNYHAAKIYACTQKDLDSAEQKIDNLFTLIERLREEAGDARTRAQDALSNLKNANANIVSLTLKDVEKDLLNLRYEEALVKLRSAAPLKTFERQVFKGFFEIAFWQNESGNPEEAYQILDTSDFLININIEDIYPFDTDTIPKIAIQSVLYALDRQFFDTLYHEKYYPKMILVEGDSIIIEEGELFEKTLLLNDFRLAQTETTVWQFALYCKATGKDINNFLVSSWINAGNNPVVNVSGEEASAYCHWLNRQKAQSLFAQNTTSKAYRLPTNEEWTFAAKGGKNAREYAYSGSANIDLVAWYSDNSNGRTQAVATTPQANSLDIYDMSGNAMEWCYPPGNAISRVSIAVVYDLQKELGISKAVADYQKKEKILRGGSWNDLNHFCRISVSGKEASYFKNNKVGFRVAHFN